ncbi:MAG: Omp28-related outer membrane protein [Muribaculaceae bacterium]|nr:Omp28-related outer membrane protein [Muribaculaceae bacterium]
MKKILTLLIAWFALVGVCQAQNGPFVVGYCDGRVVTVGTADFYSKEKKIWVSGAVFIPAGQAKTLAGNRIEKIRAGLASKSNVDSLRVWIRTSLDGEDLVADTITKATTPALDKGWNEFTLDTPYEIPEDTEGFYMGYSFYQRSTTMALSIVMNPQPNGLFVQYGNGEWTDRSDRGVLCIEADVYGDNLPQHDLALQGVRASKYLSLKSGEIDVTATVRNMALATISGYKAVCQFEGYDEPVVVDINKPIAYNEIQQVNFVVKPEMITTVPDEAVNMTVTLQDLVEGQDINMDNNSAQTSFLVIDNVFVRNVLVEEFTTEQCPNCPRVAGWLHEAMDKPEFGDVILWEHHSGYYYDSFTTDFDKTYEWFYNDGGGTYAPALMMDRYPLLANTPVDLPGSLAQLEGMIRDRQAEPAFVTIDIKAGYLDNGQLKVIVTGERAQTTFTTLPPRITVSLVEDNITTTSQAGATGAFTHHNVGRAVNAVWGEEIVWNGNNYRYECTFDVNDAWVKDNLGIIAFVSEYDSSNPVACGVANTNLLRADRFGDISEGVTGDVTGDGQVDIADVNGIIDMMLGKAESMNIADVTGDGQVDIADVNAIIDMMLGK